MRKLIVVVLAVGLVFGLSASLMAEKTKVTFLWGTEVAEMHKPVEEAFEKAFPNIDLEIIAKPPAKRMETIWAWGLAKQLPDVFVPRVGTQLEEWVDGEMLIPLSELAAGLGFDRDMYPDWVYGPVSVGGELYAMPFGITFRGFVNYNKKMLDSAGVEYPNAITSWDELADTARKLTVIDAKGITTRWGIFAKWPQSDLFRVFGGDIVNDDRTQMLFGHEPYLKGVRWYRELVDEGVLMSRQDFDDWGGSKPKLFAEEKFSMIITDIGYGGNFSKAGVDFDVVTAPRTEKNYGFPYSMGGFSVSTQAKNPKEALQFIIWWTTSVEAMEIFQEFLGDNSSPPIIASMQAPFAEIAKGRKPANWMTIYDAIPYGVDGKPSWDGCSEIMAKYIDAVMKVILGEKPTESLIEAEVECQGMLDELNAGR